MTTQSWSTRVRHDTDATFREWGLELNTKLAAAGLVQTADTGQVNWTTVTRPGASTEGGFEVWKLNDSLFGSAPVYFRIGYGTNTATTAPRIQITVGTGTNGAGTLTGTALTAIRSIHGNVTQVTDTARASYLCVKDGFFGLDWKTGSGATEAAFFFCRTVDTAGAISVTGSMVCWGAASVSSMTATQALRFATTAAAYTAQTVINNTALGLCPQTPTSTTVGSDIQAAIGYTITPQVSPLLGVLGVLDAELPLATTFTATPVGTTSHTYIALSNACGPFGSIASSTAAGGLKYAMLWE